MLALVSLVLATPKVIAIDYGGIGGRPADDLVNRSRATFFYELSGGSIRNDAVSVENKTSLTKTVSVYPTDASWASGNNFTCQQKSAPRNAVASWIELPATTITLQSHETKLVPFRVVMPSTVEPGEHNGCIVIEEFSSATKPTRMNNSLTVSLRSAIRLSVTVPGHLVKDLRFEWHHMYFHRDKYTLETSYKNYGNVSVSSNTTYSLSGIGRSNQKNVSRALNLLPMNMALTLPSRCGAITFKLIL